MSSDRDREDEGLAARIAGSYRRPIPVRPEARERLDRALAVLPAPRRRRGAMAWLIEPRLMSLRPVAAVAALAVMLGTGVWIGRLATPVDRGSHDPGAPGSEDGARAVAPVPSVMQFVLVEPRASRVVVVGDFN